MLVGKKPPPKRKEQVITHYGMLDLSPETSSHPITDKGLRQIIAFILGGERHAAHDRLGGKLFFEIDGGVRFAILSGLSR